MDPEDRFFIGFMAACIIVGLTGFLTVFVPVFL